jgi:hypothetical protein
VTTEDKHLKVGDTVGIYTVTKTNAFGPLPRAVITDPASPNKGVEVYLTSGVRP